MMTTWDPRLQSTDAWGMKIFFFFLENSFFLDFLNVDWLPFHFGFIRVVGLVLNYLSCL